MNRGSGKVLYHAVSSYQLLEVLLHRRLFHPEEEATLLLPDFIVEKYPQWPRLQHRGFFDEVKRKFCPLSSYNLPANTVLWHL